MNKILEYNVTGQSIELSSTAMLVAGTVNEYTARFSFGADWDGYQRVAVFNADGTDREQLLTDDVCKVPWEVLLPGAYLKVGVYGTRDGSRLPTIWTTHRQYIHDGAGPTDEAADPSPVLAEQILQRMGDLGELKTEDKSSLVAAVNEVKETGGGGTADHAKLKNRDAADQHPMSAITGLDAALEGKQPTGDYLTEELDPTVPEWAKQPQKPAYTAQEVGALPDTTHIPSTAEDVNAEPSGAVSQHNVSDAAHSDIRLLIQGLSERLSAVADSDDAALDQLSEIVAYIKSNKSLIDAITTSKVNVADIVDNLTTNVANKPLSAAQGVALKAIIDALTIPTALSELTEDTTHRVVTDAEKAVWNAKSNFSGSYNDLTDKPTIPEAYTLPIASPTVLGGVQPVAKTDAMTQSVGVDDAGALWAPAASGGGSGAELLYEYTLTDDGVAIGKTSFSISPGIEAWKYTDIFIRCGLIFGTGSEEQATVYVSGTKVCTLSYLRRATGKRTDFLLAIECIGETASCSGGIPWLAGHFSKSNQAYIDVVDRFASSNVSVTGYDGLISSIGFSSGNGFVLNSGSSVKVYGIRRSDL